MDTGLMLNLIAALCKNSTLIIPELYSVDKHGVAQGRFPFWGFIYQFVLLKVFSVYADVLARLFSRNVLSELPSDVSILQFLNSELLYTYCSLGAVFVAGGEFSVPIPMLNERAGQVTSCLKWKSRLRLGQMDGSGLARAVKILHPLGKNYEILVTLRSNPSPVKTFRRGPSEAGIQSPTPPISVPFVSSLHTLPTPQNFQTQARKDSGKERSCSTPTRQASGTGAKLPFPTRRIPGGGSTSKGTASMGATGTGSGLSNLPIPPPPSISGEASKPPIPFPPQDPWGSIWAT